MKVNVCAIEHEMIVADGCVIFSEKSGFWGVSRRVVFEFRSGLWYLHEITGSMTHVPLAHITRMHELLGIHIGEDHYLREPITIHEDLYLLQNAGLYTGNCVLWWGRESGYTDKVVLAKRFTSEECDKLIESTRESHIFIKHRLEDVLRASSRFCDIQDLRTLESCQIAQASPKQDLTP